MSDKWSDATAHPLDDIAAMADMVRMDTGISPPVIHLFGVKTIAYIMLGYLVENINAGLDAAKSHTLPPFTLRDHLKDCYRWLTEARP